MSWSNWGKLVPPAVLPTPSFSAPCAHPKGCQPPASAQLALPCVPWGVAAAQGSFTAMGFDTASGDVSRLGRGRQRCKPKLPPDFLRKGPLGLTPFLGACSSGGFLSPCSGWLGRKPRSRVVENKLVTFGAPTPKPLTPHPGPDLLVGLTTSQLQRFARLGVRDICSLSHVPPAEHWGISCRGSKPPTSSGISLALSSKQSGLLSSLMVHSKVAGRPTQDRMSIHVGKTFSLLKTN